jgi:hypothetical protein
MNELIERIWAEECERFVEHEKRLKGARRAAQAKKVESSVRQLTVEFNSAMSQSDAWRHFCATAGQSTPSDQDLEALQARIVDEQQSYSQVSMELERRKVAFTSVHRRYVASENVADISDDDGDKRSEIDDCTGLNASESIQVLQRVGQVRSTLPKSVNDGKHVSRLAARHVAEPLANPEKALLGQALSTPQFVRRQSKKKSKKETTTMERASQIVDDSLLGGELKPTLS